MALKWYSNLLFLSEIILLCVAQSSDHLYCEERHCALISIRSRRVIFDICHTNRDLQLFEATGLQIQEINQVTFSNCFALKSINLSNNSLQSLSRETFYANPLLEEIILAGNLITTLPPDIFDRSTNLKRLDLSRNRLRQVSPEIFKNLQQLQHLSLTENPLTDFDVERTLNYTQKLQEINLTDTHLKCERLEEIHNILRRANISILSSPSKHNNEERNYDVTLVNNKTSTCLNEEQAEYQALLITPVDQQVLKLLQDVRVLNRHQDRIINRLLELENNFKFLEQGFLKIMTEMRQEMNQLKISMENSEKDKICKEQEVKIK